MLKEIDQAYGIHGRQEWCIWGLVGRPGGKRPLGRPRCKGRILLMELQEVKLGGMDWVNVNLYGDRLFGGL